MPNPYRKHRKNVHTCEGEGCGGCLRQAWEEGYTEAYQRLQDAVRDVLHNRVSSEAALEVATELGEWAFYEPMH